MSKNGKGSDPQGLNQPLHMVFTDSNATPGKCVARPLQGGKMKLGVLSSPHPGSRPSTFGSQPGLRYLSKPQFTPTEAGVPCLALMGITSMYVSVISAAWVCPSRRSEQPSNYYIWFSVIDSMAIV